MDFSLITECISDNFIKHKYLQINQIKAKIASQRRELTNHSIFMEIDREGPYWEKSWSQLST